MTSKTFEVFINASPDKVWDTLWNDNTYRQWTSVFHQGSYVVSEWIEGSKIKFLSPDGNGMYSMIAKLIPSQFMSFQHLGVVKDGIEQPLDDDTRKWSGALENYTLQKKENGTELLVEVDLTDEFADYFVQTFPKALKIVKDLSQT